MVAVLLDQDEIDLERSIIQYFIWRVEKVATISSSIDHDDDDDYDRTKSSRCCSLMEGCKTRTTATSSNINHRNANNNDDYDDDSTVLNPVSLLSAESLLLKYNKIIKVLEFELNYLDTIQKYNRHNNSNNNNKSHNDYSESTNNNNYSILYTMWQNCSSYMNRYRRPMNQVDDQNLKKETLLECNSNRINDDDDNNDDSSTSSSNDCKLCPTTKKARFDKCQLTVMDSSPTLEKNYKINSKNDTIDSSTEQQQQQHQHCTINTTIIEQRNMRTSTLPLETQEETLKESTIINVATILSKFKGNDETRNEQQCHHQCNQQQQQQQQQQQEIKCSQEETSMQRRNKHQKTTSTSSSSTSTLTWNDRFDQLVRFHKHYGHFFIPRDCQEYPWLWDWTYYQRKNYSSNKLTQDRVDKLNSIGFDWSSPYALKKLETRLEGCTTLQITDTVLDTKETLSTTQFNNNNNNNEQQEKDLGRMCGGEGRNKNNNNNFISWAQSTREEYMRRLGIDINDPTRSKDKNSILDERFADRVTELRLVKNKCGTVNEKKCILTIFPNNTALLQWMKKQRIQYQYWKKGMPTTLTSTRRQILIELEFDFEPRKHYAPAGSRKKKKSCEGSTSNTCTSHLDIIINETTTNHTDPRQISQSCSLD